MSRVRQRQEFDAKAAVHRWFEVGWNERREDIVDEMMLPTCLGRHEGADTPLTRDEFKAYRGSFLNAVPDLHIEVLFVISEGAVSVASWRATGTHKGPGLGIPPSGRRVAFSGLTVFEFQDGRIAGGFDRWNRGEVIASLMQVRMAELREHSGLTMREAQVALLMAERFTHREIANDLGIKPNTARRHCERVLRKLGVARRQDVGPALGKVAGAALNRHGVDVE